jgi:outer membrane protein assembly factor BamD (BamD/ComL family)
MDPAAERKLLAAAQVAIRNKKYPSARAILKQHRSEFPKGILAPERNAALAIALCLDGQDAQGKKAANRFLRRNKTSPLAQRVKAACLQDQD